MSDGPFRDERRESYNEIAGDSEGRSIGGVAEQKRLDEVLNVLSESRRRDILFYLRDKRTTELDRLTDHLIEVRPSWNTEQRDRLQTTLVHKDLPLMKDSSLIEYDRRSGDICYSNPPESLRTLLNTCEDIDG